MADLLDKVITSADQVTAQWLTHVLIRDGALTGGQVESFAVDASDRRLSSISRLRIAYSEGSSGDRPAHLFLKTVNTDLGAWCFGQSEVDYYLRDYVNVDGAPLIHCYDGAYSADQHRYHLLLDDLSASHMEAGTRTPTREYGLALAEALACLHTHWWGAERIAQSGDHLPSVEQIERFMAVVRPGAGHIIAGMAEQLSPHWPAALAELVVRHPGAMLARVADANGFTLIHGDANQTNILVPRVGERPLYLIDRQPFDWSLTVWLAVYDLAIAIVLDWDVDLRRRHEIEILRHYHSQLIAQGVGDYPWPRLFDDYRLAAAMGVYVAINWCRDGINHDMIHVWWPKLQKALTACDDLNCRELWT